MIDINKDYKAYFRQFVTDKDPYRHYGEFGYDWYAACYHNDLLGLLEQTEEVVFTWSDGKDEPVYAFVALLKDGKYVVTEGGHDFTGWDCQSSLEVVGIFDTLAEAVTQLSLDPRNAYADAHA